MSLGAWSVEFIDRALHQSARRSRAIRTQEGGRPSVESLLANEIAALVVFDGIIIGGELDPW